MVRKTPWHIFFKCFQNEATQEELTEVNSWLGEDEENIEMLEEVYNIYSISAVLPAPFTPNTQKAWQNVDRKISSETSFVKRLSHKFRYVAASAAIFVFSLIIFEVVNNIRNNRFDQQYTEIITLTGQKTTILLPDSSLVWLNSGSSLKYSRDFNSTDRDVILEGEAFFDVKKDKSKKFRVSMGDFNIDVHGTSFNVKNYPTDNIQEVTVSEGVVALSVKSSEIWLLTKGEQALVNKKSGKITFTEGNPDLASAWTHNELIFKNTPLEEVVKYLERWYGVHITIEDKMKGEHNYTFKVKTESFREMLEMMKIMTPFEYEINGMEVKLMYNK